MIKIINILASATLLSTLNGAEYQINETKFEQKVSIKGIAKPQVSAEVSISPKVWGDFVIEKIVEHGTKVKKGERIVWIDTEKCDVYLREQAKERELDMLKLENAKRELDELRVSTERRLAQAETKYQRELEDFAYFNEVVIPAKIAEVKINVEAAKWSNENVREELKQLLIMYAEDGLTEETEEIIVQRQKNSVKYSDFKLQKAQESARLELEVKIPREQADRQRKHEQAVISWEFAKRTLPQALQEKEIAVEKLIMADAKKAKQFAEAKADREAMNIVAPQDGYVYYGEFEESSWDRDVASKYLHVGNKLPTQKVFMTIVPEDAKMVVGASAGSSVYRNIKVGSKGRLLVNSSPWSRFESRVTAVSQVPNTQGGWSVELSSDLPEGVALKAGEDVKVNFTTFIKESAISVPTNALTEEADGSFSVLLKMTDGETRKTTVVLGESTASKVEVLSGLSVGQVIQIGDDK